MSKAVTIIMISLLVVLSIRFVILPPPDFKTRLKLNLIKAELSKEGYCNRWLVISGLRYNWYNGILSNSAKKSYHIKGQAIDIFVFDLNRDCKFTNEDITIMQSASRQVEATHPDLIGAFGTYTRKAFLTKHMVHLDTRGYPVRYNY